MLATTKWVKLHILKNIGKIRGIKGLAEELGVASETLRKQFRRNEATPISSFINQAKVKRARILLEDTSLTCLEICVDVGFLREDSGARTFKRLTGMTMKGYRENCRLRKGPSFRHWAIHS